MIHVRRRPGVFALAGDSDGIDGTEDAASALVTPNTLEPAPPGTITPGLSLPRMTAKVSLTESAISFVPA